MRMPMVALRIIRMKSAVCSTRCECVAILLLEGFSGSSDTLHQYTRTKMPWRENLCILSFAVGFLEAYKPYVG